LTHNHEENPMNIRIAPAAGLAALSIAPHAAAQDTLQFPIAPVLAHADLQKALRGMPVRFGLRAEGPVAAGEVVRMYSWARPTDRRGGVGQLPDGRPVNMTQEQTCQLALRYTLEYLADEAREKGAKAVVDIVSGADGDINSGTQFSCVPGRASSSVYLKGRAVPALDAR
jgi:hypothetical protein